MIIVARTALAVRNEPNNPDLSQGVCRKFRHSSIDMLIFWKRVIFARFFISNDLCDAEMLETP